MPFIIESHCVSVKDEAPYMDFVLERFSDETCSFKLGDIMTRSYIINNTISKEEFDKILETFYKPLCARLSEQRNLRTAMTRIQKNVNIVMGAIS